MVGNLEGDQEERKKITLPQFVPYFFQFSFPYMVIFYIVDLNFMFHLKLYQIQPYEISVFVGQKGLNIGSLMFNKLQQCLLKS